MALSPSEYKKIRKDTEHHTAENMTGKYEGLESIDMPKGADREVLENGSTKNVQLEDQPRSLFSKHHLFYLNQYGSKGGNYPKTEDEIGNNPDLFKDIEPLDLVKNPRGGLIYNPNDFLYLKDIHNIPLNRLITVNKFAYPCSDNIYDTSVHQEPPISTMLTFAGKDYNKLSEITVMEMGMRWKPLKSEMEKMDVQGDPSGFSEGTGFTGKDGKQRGGGIIKTTLKHVSPEFGTNSIQGENRLNIDPKHDTNKSYGQVDSIDSTHIRDVGLDWNQTIKLTFKYEMRSHKGIGGKAAFIDLLSNILIMTTNDATFWGGSRYWVGQRPSKMAMNLRMMNPSNYRDFLNQGHASMKGWLGSLSSGNVLETLKSIAGNVLNLAFGKLLDSVGRPSIPMMNSLLTNDPVGNYHIIIGNPFNPIMSMGNLINEGASKIWFGDELGYEDFPTEIFVEMTFKPAMGRGREGGEMLVNGGARTYWKPKDVYKSNSNNGTVGTPVLLGDITANAINGLNWGSFSKEAVLRNSQSVYKYINRDND